MVKTPVFMKDGKGEWIPGQVGNDNSRDAYPDSFIVTNGLLVNDAGIVKGTED